MFTHLYLTKLDNCAIITIGHTATTVGGLNLPPAMEVSKI